MYAGDDQGDSLLAILTIPQKGFLQELVKYLDVSNMQLSQWKRHDLLLLRCQVFSVLFHIGSYCSEELLKHSVHDKVLGWVLDNTSDRSEIQLKEDAIALLLTLLGTIAINWKDKDLSLVSTLLRLCLNYTSCSPAQDFLSLGTCRKRHSVTCCVFCRKCAVNRSNIARSS